MAVWLLSAARSLSSSFASSFSSSIFSDEGTEEEEEEEDEDDDDDEVCVREMQECTEQKPARRTSGKVGRHGEYSLEPCGVRVSRNTLCR